MEQHSILIYILLAIVITNLIRVTPMVLIKGELHNRFVRSFLYYVPYVTLAVMTFPDMIMATPTPLPGRHRCSMVPFGTIPSRSHLLRHRLFVDSVRMVRFCCNTTI